MSGNVSHSRYRTKLAVTIIFWKIFTACFVKGIYKFDTDLVKINLIYCWLSSKSFGESLLKMFQTTSGDYIFISFFFMWTSIQVAAVKLVKNLNDIF